jgi:hypothetical protein
MAHDSSSETRRRVPRSERSATTEAPSMFGRYRRRRIDAVIDYFGECREARESPRVRSRISRTTRDLCLICAEAKEQAVLSTDGPFAETKE